MKKYILEIIVFLCGASVMILELVGSRILAPYLGTSMVIWTSLIGIILGFLSLGYYWGGRVADKNPNYKVFSLIIFSGGLFVIFIALGQSIIMETIQLATKNIYAATIIASLVLFAVPSTLFGMVSPYAVRLKMKDVEKSGQTVGNLYAISTIGSIVGTFLAGFFLIPFFGTINILFILSFVIIFVSFLAYLGSFLHIRVLAALLIIALFSANFFFGKFLNGKGVIDIETQYNRIWLIKAIDKKTKRPVLTLRTDPFGAQSAMYLDNDDDLVFDYTKFFRLANHFKPDLKNSLLIGGAAYSFPRDYLRRNSEAEIDVVEIDPKLTEVAREYFNLKDDSRLNIYHEDGRTFLNKNKNKYDIVFIDAYNSRISIPYHLTTIEAVKKIYNSLEDGGAVLVNIVSAIEGDKGLFFRAEYKTYKEIFPQVYIFPVDDSLSGEKPQNILLVAIKSNIEPELVNGDEELNGYLKNIWKKEVEMNLPVLTDDYAPVDYYTMKLIEA